MSEKNEKEGVAVKVLFEGPIALGKIDRGDNVRKWFDPAKMKELIASIKDIGQQTPVTLEKGSKEGSFVLIAGERRIRALTALGIPTANAKVIATDPATQHRIRMSENIDREPLTPIEEARGYKRALDEGQHSYEGLAERFHKSVPYIVRSVRLLELPRKVIEAIEKGVLSPEHGHQILRVPEDRREKLAEFALKLNWRGLPPTVDDVKREIESRVEKDLARACFPRDREFAGQMACSACPFNTANQNVLFSSTGGKCTNGACFTKKSNAFLKEFKEKSAAKMNGLECVGMTSGGYNGVDHIKGAAVLSSEEANSKMVKELLAKEPAKFGFGVVKPSRFGEKAPSVVIVCKDPELLAEKIRKPEKSEDRVPTQEERERDEFLREAEAYALFAEAAKTLDDLEKGHLIDIILALNGNDAAFRAVGVEASDDIAKALGKQSEKNLMRLAWLCSLDAWNLDKDMAAAGVDVKKVRKDARKAGLADWEQALKAKAKTEDKEVVGAKK